MATSLRSATIQQFCTERSFNSRFMRLLNSCREIPFVPPDILSDGAMMPFNDGDDDQAPADCRAVAQVC